MSSKTQSKAYKAQKALQLAENSAGFARSLEKVDPRLAFLSKEQWAGVFADLDEEALDDLLLVLDEEQDLKMGNDQKTKRKKQMNFSRYMRRLEQLKIRMEEMTESNK